MEELFETLKKALPTVKFGDGNNLISGGLIDSLGVITIIMTLSEEYRIEFRPDDISVENFDSIAKIWAFIQQRQKGK